MWSSTWPWPMRMPPRAFGSRYGALVMLSMPPATITSAEPARSMSCANIAARMPEPHILLTVVQPVRQRQPRAERGLARRRLALAGRAARSRTDFLDGSGQMPARSTRRRNGDSAEFGRRHRREVALESGHRRARRRYDDHRITICLTHVSTP